MEALLYLCSLEELKDNKAMGFDPFETGSDTLFAIYKDEQVFVYKNQCPHEPVSMEYKKNQFLSNDTNHIICFAHGARFEAKTGRCVHGPCLGERLSKVAFRVIEQRLYIER